LTLTGHTETVRACAISPDSTYIVTASWDRTARIWDAATGRERATLTGHTETVRACAISPDSTYIVTASWDRTARMWDAATGRERATLTGHASGIDACAISPDSTYIVTASRDATAKIWDAATGRERATLTGHTDVVNACAISPDSTYIVTASRDDTAKIWDAATGRERVNLPLLGAGMCAALHPWRPFAVWGELGGNVCLMDLVGIACGPIVVTAVDLGKGARPALRCPKCLQFHPLNDAWLGQVIVCPTPECSLSLSVNPFVTRMAVRSD
jgi:WD40 repeat protein